ncbi:hypothetical protein LCGC14_2927530, partial [marine sediment metagenome]
MDAASRSRLHPQRQQHLSHL